VINPSVVETSSMTWGAGCGACTGSDKHTTWNSARQLVGSTWTYTVSIQL